ncbi:MAG: LysR family transcriptional regulator [Actinobacteria bacterium]|nr:LysR family transcriptional regulator [Actinomycetota bacterium]
MSSRPVTLRRMEYFVAVASELHFGRAADALHIAQPALSQQIRQLETDLGLELFERTTRRVSLTADGEAFLPHAKHLLVAAAGAQRAAEDLRSGVRGRLRLGSVDSAAYELVPRFLHRFRDQRPDVAIELHTMSSDEQADALLGGVIDLGIARADPGRVGVVARAIGSEALVLAVPSNHALAQKSSVSLRELDGSTFVGFAKERSPTLHAELRVMLGRAGVTYAPALEATEYTTILGLVAAAEGVALVPSGVRGFRIPGLDFVSVNDKEAVVQLVLLTRPDEPQAIVAEALHELIATVS